MCRLFVYFNPNIEPFYLYNVIYQFDHSIIKQSYSESYTPYLKENRLNANINADGFGIGWINNYDEKFYKYKNTSPIWSDENLYTISKNVKSNIIFAHIRANLMGACAPVSLYNTHPFIINNFMWMHNGCICNFNDYKIEFILNMDKDILKNIEGSTDTEYCFGLFLTYLKEKNDPILAIKKLINFVKKLNLKSYLNFIVSNNNFLIATRVILNDNQGQAISLYYNKDKNIISSEPMELKTNNWKVVPKNSMIYINKNEFKIIPCF